MAELSFFVRLGVVLLYKLNLVYVVFVQVISCLGNFLYKLILECMSATWATIRAGVLVVFYCSFAHKVYCVLGAIACFEAGGALVVRFVGGVGAYLLARYKIKTKLVAVAICTYVLCYLDKGCNHHHGQCKSIETQFYCELCWLHDDVHDVGYRSCNPAQNCKLANEILQSFDVLLFYKGKSKVEGKSQHHFANNGKQCKFGIFFHKAEKVGNYCANTYTTAVCFANPKLHWPTC